MKQLTALILFILSTTSTTGYTAQTERVYSVGIVPQFETNKLHQIWHPILLQLTAKTGYKFKLLGSTSIPDFEQDLAAAKYDFAYMNPYHLLIANQQAGYLPLVRDHGRKLYGVLVVKKDSNITSPTQLDGKTLVFPSPNALGASLLMRQELKDQYDLNFNARYVKTHDSVYLNVLLDEADAGGGVQKTLNRQKKQYKELLNIIHSTAKVAPHPFTARPQVPIEVRERVRDALLEMGSSKKGLLLLSKIPINSIGSANLDDYLPLKTMDLERFYVAPNK
ncbi:phosphate/phosphite/phosphonate ABC transporter substrate-binding protein [Agarivorans sp. QJM3NY_25]|uniref:phosphate/phosphite/phosphonate ABC transporter substrate-binding protein n=1 Tax=Agarivorans sp. QJM3NY_25 TaxID=3421430 RepID=UPI003D7EFD09